MSSNSLSAKQIYQLFLMLDKEMASSDAIGELYVVGGAVMCLVLKARPATKDIGAHFVPTKLIRDAALRIAEQKGLPKDWLNDGVKGFLGPTGEYDTYLELEHLRVYTAKPEYLLALKVAAMRIGEGFQDLEDVRYLLRYLNIRLYQQAIDCVASYISIDRLPQKSLYALEEILSSYSQ